MKNLVIGCVGDGSLHKNWIGGPDGASFDLALIYYGDRPGRYRDEAKFYLIRKGLKWKLVHAFLEEAGGDVGSYDYVWIPDDDVMADTRSINRLFEIMAEYRLDLAQPSLSPDSHINHRITLSRENSFLRYTNFVEVMAPAFSRTALIKCSTLFKDAVSGWGMDVVWPHILNPGFVKDNVAVIDAISVTHTRPVNLKGGFYGSLERDPFKEMGSLLDQYGLKLRPYSYKYRPMNDQAKVRRTMGFCMMLFDRVLRANAGLRR